LQREYFFVPSGETKVLSTSREERARGVLEGKNDSRASDDAITLGDISGTKMTEF
jgi:hypothetical protein